MSRDGAPLSERILRKTRVDLRHAGAIALGLLVFAGMIDALTAQSPVSGNPGFIGTILASHGVVAAVRIAIIFGAVYLVLSVVALARSGRWLTRVGPAEAGEVTQAVGESQEYNTELAEVTEEVEWLRTRLEAADQLALALVARVRSGGNP